MKQDLADQIRISISIPIARIGVKFVCIHAGNQSYEGIIPMHRDYGQVFSKPIFSYVFFEEILLFL